jgi:hypothetical protein
MTDPLDHIVVICDDLERGAAHFTELTGVRPVYGGAHASGLTHNALVGLGGHRYLEILAPAKGPAPDDDEWTRCARAAATPRVFTYCLRSTRPLPELAAIGSAKRWPHGGVTSNGRTTPEGVRLRWEWFAPRVEPFGYSFPFFIDWLDSVHPSDALRTARPTEAIRLSQFAVGHPDADRLGALLSELGTRVDTYRVGEPAFRVHLDTPNGPVAL